MAVTDVPSHLMPENQAPAAQLERARQMILGSKMMFANAPEAMTRAGYTELAAEFSAIRDHVAAAEALLSALQGGSNG